MFTNGFQKTAGFFDGAAKMFKAIKPSATNVAKAVTPSTSIAKPLATRLDGSKVMTGWGLQQGVRNGSVRYGNIN